MLFRRSQLGQAGHGCLSSPFVQESVAPQHGLWLLCPLWSELKQWELLRWGKAPAEPLQESTSLPSTRATHVRGVPDLLSVLCWVLSLSCDPSVHFRGRAMLSAWCWLYVVGGCQGQGAGKEAPSPPLSERAHLMFLTVVAAYV